MKLIQEMQTKLIQGNLDEADTGNLDEADTGNVDEADTGNLDEADTGNLGDRTRTHINFKMTLLFRMIKLVHKFTFYMSLLSKQFVITYLYVYFILINH